MSGSHSLAASEPTEYETIATALGGTARGRWFLEEHARRSRSADTDVLLGAMARLETAVAAGRPADDLGNLRGGLMEMANAIGRTRAEIAAISDPDLDQTRLSIASEALDAIVRATEGATTDILVAAEEMQEAAWTLRERGIDPEICDTLDRHATQIYTACSFQDLTAQRTGRIVETLRYLEERLFAMMAIWGDGDVRVPPAPGRAQARTAKAPQDDLCQSDVDRYIAMAGPATAAANAAALRAIEPGALSLHDDIVFLPTQPEPEPAAPETGPEWAEAFEADIREADAEETDIAADETNAAGDEQAADDAVAPVAAGSEVEPALSEPCDAPESSSAADRADVADDAEPRPDAARNFADIDALSVEEKLALFC